MMGFELGVHLSSNTRVNLSNGLHLFRLSLSAHIRREWRGCVRTSTPWHPRASHRVRYFVRTSLRLLRRNAEWMYQTDYFINDTNQESTATGAAGNDQKNPSYTVTNLKAGYNTMIGNQWELELFSRLDNIFDANYFTSRLNPGTSPSFSPFPGRNVFGGFSVRYLFL